MNNEASSVALRAAASWAQGAAADQLVAGFLAGAAAWPGVLVEPAKYAEYVRARLQPTPDGALEPPEALHLPDLYLTCGCFHGEPRALVLFERDVLAPLRPALRSLGRGEDFVDEAMQVGREQLLVRSDKGGPRIAEYGGRGALRGWTRVVLSRIGLMAMRRQPVMVPHSQVALPDGGGESFELERARAQYLPWFREAVQGALQVLTREERQLLEQHVRQGRSFAEIGAALGVNKSTISRRIAAARTRVLAEVERLAKEHLRVDGSEYRSLVRLVRSQIDVTLDGVVSRHE